MKTRIIKIMVLLTRAIQVEFDKLYMINKNKFIYS